MNYVHNAHNPGVSKAYNEGCELARKKEKRWLLLMDQDTSLPAGWLGTYFQNTAAELQSSIYVPILFVGSIVISPFRYWLTKGVPSRRVEPGSYSVHRYFALNSGLLIGRDVFESVGGYDESIPLYFSDFAFMRKLKKNNYHLTVLELPCQHGLSALEKQDVVSARVRFKQYCQGSKRFTQYTHQSFLHFCIAGGRAIRLGIRHRSLNFIAILIQSWVTD